MRKIDLAEKTADLLLMSFVGVATLFLMNAIVEALAK